MSKFTSLQEIYKAFLASTGICTDTRKIAQGNVFWALKGGNFNGNSFAAKALELGAKFVIVDEKEFAIDNRILLVEDGLIALQQLANYHRKQFDIPVIAITGSNGKTTSKELVSSVLKTKYKTHFTYGNLNNHIGVPLTLLSMPQNTEIAVIEMGANHQGEIAELCQIAEPTHGLITNIGKAHLEGFGGVAGVLKGKTELFQFLKQNKGTVFINGASEPLMQMIGEFDNPKIYSGTDSNAYLFANLIEVNPFIKLSYKTYQNIQTQLIGSYNFENILAALAIAKFFGIEDKNALDAISNYSPSNNRSQVIEKNGIKILLDAYNANPTSMEAALKNFQMIDHTPKITILGDMFELGDDSEKEHILLFNNTMSRNFTHSFFVGGNFKKAFPDKENVFKTKEELLEKLKSISLKEALLLIKGSRGIGLETILESIS